MKKNVAVLMGGYSSEYNISLKSGEVVYNTLLKEDDINLFKVIISKNEWKCVDSKDSLLEIKKDSFQFIRNNNLINVDLVFNTVHGIPGENGEIQSYFENLNIKQTSSESSESKLTFDKDRCKNDVKKIGYLIPNSILVKKEEDINTDNILNKKDADFITQMQSEKSKQNQVNNAFLSILSRKPNSKESGILKDFIDEANGFKHVSWILLNSHEFIFIK